MIALISKATHVITDSGGLQKDAFFLKKPCSTYRNTTEWQETLIGEQNALIINPDNTIDTQKLIARLTKKYDTLNTLSPYGNGHASEAILKIIENHAA
jgi:UDP-N-acetylglucosamine 2-epimerase (non-hydrolysing)